MGSISIGYGLEASVSQQYQNLRLRYVQRGSLIRYTDRLDVGRSLEVSVVLQKSEGLMHTREALLPLISDNSATATKSFLGAG